jgi:hypothetical protein
VIHGVSVDPAHLSERLSLFVTIVLGESVAQVVNAAAAAPYSISLFLKQAIPGVRGRFTGGIGPARLQHAFSGLLRRLRGAVGVLRSVVHGRCGVRLAWVASCEVF